MPGSGRAGPGVTDSPGPNRPRSPPPKLILFCVLTPATAVAAFGLIVSLQVQLTGDSGSGWPHGWSSVVECALALAVVGSALAWVIWTERERLAAAIRR